MEKCAKLFTVLCDGVSGIELLGMFLVVGMVALLWYVQVKDSGSARRVDFSWLFLDDKTGKVSRSGVLNLGGFLLGCWVVADAEQSGHLDWGFLGTFLAYCAGLRAIEVFKPVRPEPDPPALTRTTVTEENVLQPKEKPDGSSSAGSNDDSGPSLASARRESGGEAKGRDD